MLIAPFPRRSAWIKSARLFTTPGANTFLICWETLTRRLKRDGEGASAQALFSDQRGARIWVSSARRAQQRGTVHPQSGARLFGWHGRAASGRPSGGGERRERGEGDALSSKLLDLLKITKEDRFCGCSTTSSPLRRRRGERTYLGFKWVSLSFV